MTFGTIRKAMGTIATGAVALGVVALAPSIACAQGNAGARPISLEEAVRLAQQNSPLTVQARNANRTSESAVRASLAQFLPTASFSYSGNQAGGTQFVQGTPVPTSGLPWSYSRSVSSNLTLYDGGQRNYNYRAAQANMESAGANEVAQRYSVALTVKTQYFNVLAANEQMAASKQLLEQAQQQLNVASAKMKAGVATLADSLTSAIAVGNAKLSILTAENSLRNANAALTRLVASPVMVTATLADTMDTGKVDLDEAQLLAMVSDGPSVRQSTQALEAARAQHKAATTPYMPTLALNASYGQNPKQSQNFNFGGGPTATSTRFGLSLNYTIFNNYTREQSLLVARVNAENAEANLRDAKALVVQNLTTFLSNYRTAQSTIELQLLTIQSAREALRVVQQRYNLGTSSLLEVLQAETTLDNARAQLINARVNARIAKANIEALIGRDLK
ncbi:MAG: TolC family protein [Gemmatimonadetes bacterium]|nr:TolC family protein [Gemmatimonadota bacterium]